MSPFRSSPLQRFAVASPGRSVTAWLNVSFRTVDPPDTSRISVSWRTVAVVGAVLAVCSTTALIVVASVRGANALSTIALSLAIVAFSSQIIIAIGQSRTDAEQIRRTEEIATRTLTALTEVQTTTQGMLHSFEGQFSKVLERVLSKTLEGDSDSTSSERLVPTYPEPSMILNVPQTEEEVSDEAGEDEE